MNHRAYFYGISDDAMERTEAVLAGFGIPYVEVDRFELILDEVRPGDLVVMGWDAEHTEEVKDLRERHPGAHVLFVSPTLAAGITRRTPMVGAFLDVSAPHTEEPASDSTDDILTLMELGRLLTSTLELDELYEQIIEQVHATFRPNTVSLMLLHPGGESLRVVAHRGLPKHITPDTPVPVDDSIAGSVVREARPQLLLGGLDGTRFARLARGDTKIASAMSIPLQVKDSTLGVLNVNRYKGQPTYTDKDASLLHIFAAQIAIAIQNAQLYASLRQERDRIMEGQEVVRRELARDLHDGLSQMLAAMSQNISILQSILKPGEPVPAVVSEDLEYLSSAVRQAIQDARTLTFGLRPLVLETQGIAAALRQYIATLNKSDKKTHYELAVENIAGPLPWSINDARTAFAIIQEAISNARKHAKAQNVWVRLVAGKGANEPFFVATVRDDGAGFDVEAVTAEYETRLSFGLNSMRERAELLDATLNVSSSVEGGTTVELIVARKP